MVIGWPFSYLDADIRTDLRQQICRIVKDIGTSMVFRTHDNRLQLTAQMKPYFWKMDSLLGIAQIGIILRMYIIGIF